MALNIRNPEADALATELAELTGETKTEAVTTALRERLERTRRLRATRTRRRLVDEIAEIASHCSSLPRLGRRTDEEILGYDEHGLPG